KVTRPRRAAARSGRQAVALVRNSAKYRRRNSGHFLGSCRYHFRSAGLGAASLGHPLILRLAFFTPRGQSRSTRKRAPSPSVAGSSARLSLIMRVLLSPLRPLGHATLGRLEY